jgi:hypothetical protein
VTAVRTFSINAGLAASIVTPGSTAPDASLAVPAMAPVVPDCPVARPGRNINAAATATNTNRPLTRMH